MPFVTGHGLAGLMSAYYFKESRLRLWQVVLCVLAANFPDFDYIPGLLIGAPKRFHPSLTHSFFAAALFALMVYWISKHLAYHNRHRWTRILGAAYTSHLFLDIIQFDTYTINGIGIPLFYPFSSECYQTGWNWFPNLSSFVDFSSSSSFLQSILHPELLRYLLHEQLVIGAIIIAVFGVRRIWNLKVSPCRQPPETTLTS